MKIFTTLLFAILLISGWNSVFAQSDIFVDGYFRKNGTYVQPHFKTAPNSSMFDNYSTKGNFNPYTGKPGWVDPYSKVSSSYYEAIPHRYRHNYDKLFIYLNKKDSYNYFKIVDEFDYQYKLFYTGIFKINNNETKDANQIFDLLRKYQGASNFISVESNYWFDITSKYLDADAEYNSLYLSSAQFQKDGNYQALEKQLNNVKNALNFYHKYIIKFETDRTRHKYLDAINSLDSLIVYASGTELHDTLYNNYNDIVANLTNMQNTVDTRQNGTYYYTMETLVANLQYYLIHRRTPAGDLKKACFKLFDEKCTPTDTSFFRSLNDTSYAKSGVAKMDRLTFGIRGYENIEDSAAIIGLQFLDDSSYAMYKNELSRFSKYHSCKNSLVYDFRKPEDKTEGLEYLINDVIICGLTEEKLGDNVIKGYSKKYMLYFYSFIDKNDHLMSLSFLFK